MTAPVLGVGPIGSLTIAGRLPLGAVLVLDVRDCAGMPSTRLSAITKTPERRFDVKLFSHLGGAAKERLEIWQTWPEFLASSEPASPQTLSFSTLCWIGVRCIGVPRLLLGRSIAISAGTGTVQSSDG